MTYNIIAVMAHDPYLKLRITACVAEQGHQSPEWWVDQNLWVVVASPGWAASYEYAMNAGGASLPDLYGSTTPLPYGRDEAVITDATILATVQPMLG